MGPLMRVFQLDSVTDVATLVTGVQGIGRLSRMLQLHMNHVMGSCGRERVAVLTIKLVAVSPRLFTGLHWTLSYNTIKVK